MMSIILSKVLDASKGQYEIKKSVKIAKSNEPPSAPPGGWFI
jgi:hypothetical protein